MQVDVNNNLGVIKKYLLLILFLLIINFSNFISVSALSVAVHVPEKYTDVVAGERFYFEIEVKYPENPKRKDLKLNYEIIDSDGKLIAQSKVLKAVETQASFIDFFIILGVLILVAILVIASLFVTRRRRR